MLAQDAAGPGTGAPMGPAIPPMPPQAPAAGAGVSSAPDPALLPAAPMDGAPAAAANAAWLPPTVPVQPSQNGAAGEPSVPAVPAIADDGDLIEKEWVVKVKEIVGRTRQDPYQQTKELHAFKAEYMKKRYNKVIGPVDE